MRVQNYWNQQPRFSKAMSGFRGLTLHHVSSKIPWRGCTSDKGCSTLPKYECQKNVRCLPSLFTFSKTPVTSKKSWIHRSVSELWIFFFHLPSEKWKSTPLEGIGFVFLLQTFFFNKIEKEKKKKMNACETTNKLHAGYHFSCWVLWGIRVRKNM